MFTREDWTLFRSLGTLGQKAGVPLRRLAALVVKELVDNALDAGATAHVQNDGDWIYVIDDGAGLPGDAAAIARLFSIKRPLTSSKMVRVPSRGALGNGLRVVAGGRARIGRRPLRRNPRPTLRPHPTRRRQHRCRGDASAIPDNWHHDRHSIWALHPGTKRRTELVGDRHCNGIHGQDLQREDFAMVVRQ